MAAVVALFAMVSFAACSSDDDDSPQTYTKGITANKISGASLAFKAYEQIKTAYDDMLGKESPFQGASDAKVKALAEEAEKTISELEWADFEGTLTYTIKNVNSGKTIYSKTFSSDDGGNQIPRPPKRP